MSDGIFGRFNASMINENGMGGNMIISVIGAMESTDGTTMSLRTSDGVLLQYAIMPEFDFVQVKIHERITTTRRVSCHVSCR